MTVGITATGRADGVTAAIRLASQRTGVDFGYLMGQARVESGLRPDARAATSSATGLYQFLDQSWLAVVAKHGDKHGLGWAADAVSHGPGGRLSVDPALRGAVMNLRTDSRASALMAAEHAADNKAALEAHLGRDVGGTDLYMAHFLGLGGAKRFLTRMDADPAAPAAALFPQAAGANRAVFYDRAGTPRTLTQVYQRFADKLGTEAAGNGGNSLPDAAAPTPVATDQTLGLLTARAPGSEALMRPTPATARLAYLMLASLGA